MEKLPTKKELTARIVDQVNTDEDEIRTRISKRDRIDFEYLINWLDLTFEYREENSDSDYWGVCYVPYQLRINETEKYRVDIQFEVDFDFADNLDDVIRDILFCEKKAQHILLELNKKNNENWNTK